MDLLELLSGTMGEGMRSDGPGSLPQRLVLLAGLLLAVWIGRRLSWPLAWRLVRLSRYAHRARAHRPERQTTLQGLIADLIGFAVLIVAFIVGVVQLVGVDIDTVVWTVGLLSAGFGLGARPIISDILAGISYVFEDAFSVGEKVLFAEVEGVIEQVNLRTTHIRAPSGELCIVPNGEIRVMRNFSRGRFSTANVTLSVASSDLGRALEILEDLGPAAAEALPDLNLPWQLISKSGELGTRMELTLLARTRFGTGAELRPRLMALVHERLSAAGIDFDA